MNIKKGFQIEVPNVFVPWGISAPELRKLLDGFGLQRKMSGYFILSSVVLGGMSLELRLFFPSDGPSATLGTLKFVRKSIENLNASFDEFQTHLEQIFGAPTHVGEKAAGFFWYSWKIAIDSPLYEDRYISISHYVSDSGMKPEERIEITQYRHDKPFKPANELLNELLRKK